MMYGCQMWGQNCNPHMIKIFKLHNRAIRIINFEDYDVDTNPLYKRNEILMLEDLIKLQNILHVHDYLNNSPPDCFRDYYYELNCIYFNVQTRNSKLGCLFMDSTLLLNIV